MRDRANSLSEGLYKLGANPMLVKTSTSNIYSELRGMGQSKESAANMSAETIKRAYDISALKNLSPERALGMFQSSLVGLNMRFREIGIVITKNEVKNYAYADSIAKVGSELTEAQKSAASYGLAMQKTAFAAGDFEATQSSSANQIRKLQSQWQVFLGTIGKAFEPFFNQIINFATSVMPILQRMAQDFMNVANLVYKLAMGIQGAVFALTHGMNVSAGFATGWKIASNYITNYSDDTRRRAAMAEDSRDAANAETEAMKKQNKAIKDNIQSFDELHIIKKDTEDTSNGDSGGAGGMDSGINYPEASNTDNGMPFGNGIWDKIRNQ